MPANSRWDLIQRLRVNLGVNVIRPTFNLEPKYRVTMVTREEWTRGPGTAAVFKGFVWFTRGSRMEGNGAGVYGQSLGRRHSISLWKYATVFQAELHVYTLLAMVYEIQTIARPEKYGYVSICYDSQEALKALQAAKTTHLLAQQCQTALNDVSTLHIVGLYLVTGHAGVRRNESPTSSQETVLIRSL